MGKAGRNRQKRLKSKSVKVKEKLLPTFSIDELLDKAQEEINVFHYKEAQVFCQQALKRDCDNLRALEISASLCIELGNYDDAKHCLGRVITLAPDNGFSKYLSMGQLLAGKESLQCYLKGIELMEKELAEERKQESECEQNKSELSLQQSQSNSKIDSCENGDLFIPNGDTEINNITTNDSLLRKVSNANCAVAELYMSDLCDEDNAETESITYIEKAIDLDNSNPEAYLHKANFLLITEKFDEAKIAIQKSVSLWLPKYLEVDNGEASAGSFDPVDICPLSESAKFLTSRILIEVEDHKLAADVLEVLLGENDEVVYTWYLLGWNLYLRGDEFKGEAKQHFEKAMEIQKISPCSDENVLEHIKELLQELKDISVLPENNDVPKNFEAEIEKMDVP